MKAAISVAAGIVFLVGFLPYIYSILRKGAQPAKASWIIWATIDTITIAGMYFKDALNGQMVGVIIGGWVVAVLSLKYGKAGWTLLDKLSLAGAALGIALWLVFSDPVLAIVTSLAVCSIGSVPTFVSAWKDPSKEDKAAWTLFWISCILAVIAIPKTSIQDVAQPVTFLTIETIMMFILYIRPALRKNPQRIS